MADRNKPAPKKKPTVRKPPAAKRKKKVVKVPERKAPAKKKAGARKPAPKKKAAPKRGKGRPAHEPTPELRRRIERLIGYGMTRRQCADIMRLDIKTIMKHYDYELKTGDIQAGVTVADSIFRMAVGSPAQYDKDGNLIREEQKPNITAAIWFSKARMGWHEPAKEMKLGGLPDAPAIKQETTVVGGVDDPDRYDPADLAARYRQALAASGTVH